MADDDTVLDATAVKIANKARAAAVAAGKTTNIPARIAAAVLEAVAGEVGAAALRLAADDAERALDSVCHPPHGSPSPDTTRGAMWVVDRLRRQADLMLESS